MVGYLLTTSWDVVGYLSFTQPCHGRSAKSNSSCSRLAAPPETKINQPKRFLYICIYFSRPACNSMVSSVTYETPAEFWADILGPESVLFNGGDACAETPAGPGRHSYFSEFESLFHAGTGRQPGMASTAGQTPQKCWFSLLCLSRSRALALSPSRALTLSRSRPVPRSPPPHLAPLPPPLSPQALPSPYRPLPPHPPHPPLAISTPPIPLPHSPLPPFPLIPSFLLSPFSRLPFRHHAVMTALRNRPGLGTGEPGALRRCRCCDDARPA